MKNNKTIKNNIKTSKNFTLYTLTALQIQLNNKTLYTKHLVVYFSF